MLNLIFSNRYEILRDRLFEELAGQRTDPFEPEQIIVPGSAIRRRLEMDYADRFGICANVAFGYLAQWIWQQIGRVVPVADISPFDAERLAWRIFRAFGDQAFVSSYPRLAGYLAKADTVMHYELAQRTARLLEQYIAYRPDWTAAWLDPESAVGGPSPPASPDAAWQAALWRRLAVEMGVQAEHPAAVFARVLASSGLRTSGLLQPASLFCLPTVPPLYIDVLVKIGKWVDLSLYLLSPCREYWYDLIPNKRLARLDAAAQADYHEVGHPLLSSWGRQTQAFFAVLHDKCAGAAMEHDEYPTAANSTLLAAVQDSILTLSAHAHFQPAADDRSIEVHVCHSLTRELEVLHDQLLDMMSGASGMTPADVLVVLPELEKAAPLIHAVFGTASEDRRIPYVITGLPRAAANPAAAAVLALLALLTSRFKAGEVFDLLRRPLVHSRFGLDECGLESIHGWMRLSGICWGLDGAHRRDCGLPDSDHHSLRDGLDRLFLGYALPASDEALGGRLPAGNVEGSDALALGAFDHYVGLLEEARREGAIPADGEVWRERLLRWLDEFLSVGPDSIHDLMEVRTAIAVLCDDLAAGAPSALLDQDLVRAALKSRLEDPARGAVPSGAVTFAGIGPLRSLPYRVVCVLGLNDGVFPAVTPQDELDLMAVQPRAGDRLRRDDERNLFLDLILATRDRLYLSYTGFSIRDNGALTPSILLAELLDHVSLQAAADSASAAARREARQRLTVHHPLQPFSRDYFTGAEPRLFSYASEYLPIRAGQPVSPQAASGATPALDDAGGDEDELREDAAPFLGLPLRWRPEEVRALSVDDLKRFLRNPCRYLLEHRLEISLMEAEEQLADDEPFLPDFHQRSRLAQRLLSLVSRGAGEEELIVQAQSGTEYPTGMFGEVLLRQEVSLIAAYGQALTELTRAPLLAPVAATLQLTIDGESWLLSGALNDLRPAGLVRSRYDDTRPVDYLLGWIEHLFLNAIAPQLAGRTTTWRSRDGGFWLKPCDEARSHLATLVGYYRQGLAEPLRFFPNSAWAYVRAQEPLARLAAARKCWDRNDYTGRGESTNPAYRLALRGIDDPLDKTFEQAASAIFDPLLAHLEDEPL